MAEARFYIRLAKGVLGDRKLCALTDGERWAWAALLIMADDAKPAGTLTESADDLAFRARVDPVNMRGVINKLTAMERPPLTLNADRSLTVTKWADHQGARYPSAENDAVAERMREYRARKRNDSDSSNDEDVTNVTNVTDGYSVTSVTALIPSHPIALHPITEKVVEDRGVRGESEVSQSQPLAADAAPTIEILNPNGNGKPPKKETATDPKGTRIPVDFTPGHEGWKWARLKWKEVPVPVLSEAIKRRTENFVAYWSNLPGPKARKLNWYQTWQNSITDDEAGGRLFRKDAVIPSASEHRITPEEMIAAEAEKIRAFRERNHLYLPPSPGSGQ